MKKRYRQLQPNRINQQPARASFAEGHGTGVVNGERNASPIAQIYDDGLIDRSREQWRRGDWEALGLLSAEEVERHPERARLALMAAAAHQAQGNAAQTRLFVRLATQWGCDPRLLARVLLAGVHNTLGRAAAAGGKHRERAVYHFNEAVAPGVAGASRWLATQARVRHQLEQLQLGAEATPLLAGGRGQSLPQQPIVATPFRELTDALKKNNEYLLVKLREQADQSNKLQKTLELSLKRELGNAVKQIEAFGNLQGYLASGKLVPALHGWPISPDFGVLLIELIEERDYDVVIEFGSGTSTVLMAKSIATQSALRMNRREVVQVAFEHLTEYLSKTQSALERTGFSDRVQLVHAPLRAWKNSHGVEYSYYACEEALDRIFEIFNGQPFRVLVVVDGPPAKIGNHARYPALPIVLSRLIGANVDVLLDDHDRIDEQQVTQMWMEELTAAGRPYSIAKQDLEKGACLLSIDARLQPAGLAAGRA